MKKTTKKQTQKFVIVTKACEDVYFHNFAFDAENQEDANDKAFGWARYQGFCTRDVFAQPAAGEETNWTSHNEWVN